MGCNLFYTPFLNIIFIALLRNKTDSLGGTFTLHFVLQHLAQVTSFLPSMPTPLKLFVFTGNNSPISPQTLINIPLKLVILFEVTPTCIALHLLRILTPSNH